MRPPATSRRARSTDAGALGSRHAERVVRRSATASHASASVAERTHPPSSEGVSDEDLYQDPVERVPSAALAKDYIAAAGNGTGAPLNRDYPPWCYVPVRATVNERLDWLKERGVPFYGEGKGHENGTDSSN